MPIFIDSSQLHPSTRLALSAIEWLEPRIQVTNILDVGCGNGILSLTANHVWGSKVLACDISENAIADIQSNIKEFAPEAPIIALRSDGVKHPAIKQHAPYDLILANLLAEWQVAMAHDIAKLLTPGGHIVLSGILAWQTDGVKEAFSHMNIHTIHEVDEHEWHGIIARHGAVI